VHSLHYDFVFTTKYRKPVLVGEIGHSVRDLIQEICRSEDIEMLEGRVRPNHVHLLLTAPPHLAPSRVMQAIKGKTSHHLLSADPNIIEGCGRRSGGNVTDEAIAEYIRLQGAEPQDDDRLLANEQACMRGSARLFSRLQSTHNPSPSGCSDASCRSSG
jgi:putative transposase